MVSMMLPGRLSKLSVWLRCRLTGHRWVVFLNNDRTVLVMCPACASALPVQEVICVTISEQAGFRVELDNPSQPTIAAADPFDWQELVRRARLTNRPTDATREPS